MCRIIFTVVILFLSVTLHAQPYLQVLGIAQDGGYPHIGCRKQCCKHAWDNPQDKRYVVSFALVDPEAKQWWLFEATPDIKEQLQYFNQLTGNEYKYLPDGIFLTHAHIGHYTGLAQLGREALGAKKIKVYTLPKMKQFLEHNGPWQQLVQLQNIDLVQLNRNSLAGLTKDIRVQALTVPHRDEYSETAGFIIHTSQKKYLFIPDIDKWAKWNRNIIREVEQVDIALLDATFYDANELPGRRMEEVPHPFVTETMELFSGAGEKTKAKVYFIHMNHTNPLLWNKTIQQMVIGSGYKYATQGMKL